MPTCARCGQELAAGFRFCPSCGAPASEPATQERESRKVVTSLFCDVVGSTSLGERTDAETVRRVMLRYFEVMRAAVERHGGTVDKFIGDAVMAVFGIPLAHEDDALRAIRAALDMRGSLTQLNLALERDWSVRLEIRIGINTGEALAAGMVSGQTIVLGDAVNVAARLQNVASAGGIVIGEETLRLVADAVRVEPLPALELKGKGTPLRAFELRGLVERPQLDAQQTPLVAREAQLARLTEAFDATVRERRCRLMTLTGPPGIGKSRLAQELSAGLSARGAVYAGRCPSYGEGITLRPLAQIAHAMAGDHLHDGLRQLLGDLPQADAIATRVASALGEESSAAGAREETFWAFRRVFEAFGARAPLVLILDDLHWAQPMLLDLLDHLVAQTRDATVLIVGTARPELLHERPGWATGAPDVEVIRLEPLSAADSRALVDHLIPPARLDPSVRRHVIEQAEGNPLFIEQLLAFIEHSDQPTLRMPPTIQALLAARLDRLPPVERDVCERAAVIGRTFTLEMLARLGSAADGAAEGAAVAALVRRDLMRAEESRRFAFAHTLIRDAAYDATPKERRAALHEMVAGELESPPVDAAGDLHRLVGHHLDQAYRLSRELGRPEERLEVLRERAAEHLALAGQQALDTADVGAAADLLRRAVELQDPRHPTRPTLVLDLVHALWMADLPREADRVIAALEAAGTGEHEQALACAARAMFVNRYGRERAGETDALRASIRTLEAIGDDRGLARARWAAAMTLALAGQLAAAERECEAAIEHARAAGDERMVTVLLSWLADYAPLGPMPVTEGLERCRRLLEELRGRPFGEVSCCWGMALLHAMEGDPARARERLAAAGAILEDVALGPAMNAWAAFNAGAVEFLAGVPQAAEAQLRAAHDAFERLDQRPSAQQAAALLARALCAQGRYEEAVEWAEIGAGIAPLDPAVGAIAFGAQARAIAHLGRVGEAEAVAREALRAACGTDEISEQADAATDLAEVLRLAGRKEQAAEVLQRAVELYELKGNAASARRARGALAELVAQPHVA